MAVFNTAELKGTISCRTAQDGVDIVASTSHLATEAQLRHGDQQLLPKRRPSPYS